MATESEIESVVESAVERSEIAMVERLHAIIDRRLSESFLAMSTRLENNILMGLQRRQLDPSGPIPESIKQNSGLGTREGQWLQSRRTPASPALFSHTRNRGLHDSVLCDSKLSCQCRCHILTHVCAGSLEVSWLHNILGAIRISYSGPNTIWINKASRHSKCLPPDCKNRQNAQGKYRYVVIQYLFPPWLAMAMLSMYFFRHGRPELLLRVHRIIPAETTFHPQGLIDRIRTNDFQAVKHLLTTYPSSVHDVTAPSGISALMYAVQLARTDMAKLLLQAGADPFQESFLGRSAARYIMFQFLYSNTGNPDSPGPGETAYGINLADVLEHDDYTDLHRAVIGGYHLNLATALEDARLQSQVNSKTLDGLTPLHLAAGLFPTDTEVRLLLNAGADPNAVAHHGRDTPLHWASLGGNEQVVKALVSAGASPQFSAEQAMLRRTLLHAAAQRSGSATTTGSLVAKLLSPEYGIHINTPDGGLIAPLTTAAVVSNLVALEDLILHGACITTKDKDGNTVLDNAVYFGAHEAARIVLGLSGAPRARCYAEEVRETYRNVNHRGRGILHHLAEYGDKEMMEIFANLGMTGIPEPETFRDSEGKTAVDLFDERVRGVYGVGSIVTNGFRPATVSKCSSVSEEKQRLELIRAWTELLASHVFPGNATKSTSKVVISLSCWRIEKRLL